MTSAAHTTLVAILIGCCAQCGPPEPSRPTDPGSEEAAFSSALVLTIPLSKTLVSVVDSLVAVLSDAQGRPMITKQLQHSPLGPATLTIGAVSPGSGYRLTISGYDHARRHILQGEQDGIVIAVGDTLPLTMVLSLLISPAPEDTSGGDAPEG